MIRTVKSILFYISITNPCIDRYIGVSATRKHIRLLLVRHTAHINITKTDSIPKSSLLNKRRMAKDTTITIHDTCGNMYIIHISTLVSLARSLRSLAHSQRKGFFFTLLRLWSIIRSVQFGNIALTRSQAVWIESTTHNEFELFQWI